MNKRRWIGETVLVAGLAIGGATFAVSAATRNVEGRSAKAPSNSFFGPRTRGASTASVGRRGYNRADLHWDRSGSIRIRSRVSCGGEDRFPSCGSRATGCSRPLLLRLDSTDFRLAVKVAEADLITAEADVLQTTAEDNRSVGSAARAVRVSPTLTRPGSSARDMAIGRRDRTSESLTLARNRLSYCDLYADAAGVITTLFVEAGQVVSEGQTVARLARDGEKEAVVELPENQGHGRSIGTGFGYPLVSPGGIFQHRFTRVITDRGPSDANLSEPRFTIQNPGVKVALGMTATVHLTPADASPGYVLPLTSLLRNGDQAAVWLVDRTTGKLTLAPRHRSRISTRNDRSRRWRQAGPMGGHRRRSEARSGDDRPRGRGTDERRQPVGLGGQAPGLRAFLILMSAAAGIVGYLGMGRAEDPSFTIKTMVVTAKWPGATATRCSARWPTDRGEAPGNPVPRFPPNLLLPGRRS